MGSDGISTGLRFWLIFFLGFALTGYPPGLSLILGLIGGLSMGWLRARWLAKNQMGSLEGAETPWQTTQRQFQQFKSQIQSCMGRKPRNPRMARSRSTQSSSTNSEDSEG
ncbi:MAG: hypothetical protein IGR76_16495 [Synechococcales cyanobacterium T60_A2020_003]|nr:hypothetical protein [Synechococcales cyanobacterium T60_A2020_003]